MQKPQNTETLAITVFSVKAQTSQKPWVLFPVRALAAAQRCSPGHLQPSHCAPPRRPPIAPGHCAELPSELQGMVCPMAFRSDPAPLGAVSLCRLCPAADGHGVYSHYQPHCPPECPWCIKQGLLGAGAPGWHCSAHCVPHLACQGTQACRCTPDLRLYSRRFGEDVVPRDDFRFYVSDG